MKQLRLFVMGGAMIATATMAAAQTAPANAPTFTKDVAPIFQDKCEACHRPDSIARTQRGSVMPVGCTRLSHASCDTAGIVNS